MLDMKKYFDIGVTILFIVLVGAVIVLIRSKARVEDKWKTAVENVKAYSEQYSSSEAKNRAFKLTIEQLEYSNDSILQKLNQTRNELKVKDSKLKSMQYITSVFTKTDTLLMRDTIFKSQDVNIDTMLAYDWYSVRVGLKYPSTITVTPEFKSEKHIIVSTKRETVNPPKKFFLFRWFQKKHTVLNIDVVEKNPYIVTNDNRYVEVIG